MKSNKKRVVALDEIKQKQNQHEGGVRSRRKNNKKKYQNSSGQSSDFSQFQLQSKDINNGEFLVFNKPDLKKKQDGNEQYPKIEKKKSKKQADLHVDKKKNKKQKNVQIVSFKKTPSLQNLFKQDLKDTQTKSPLKPDKNDRNNQQDNQPLIQQYSKSQFTNKSPQRKAQVQQYSKTVNKLKPQPRQENVQQNGIKQTTGGICFQVNKGDFVFEQPKQRKVRKRNSKKIKVGINPSSKQQLLFRRQTAFRYGQFVRRRTFGYY